MLKLLKPFAPAEKHPDTPQMGIVPTMSDVSSEYAALLARLSVLDKRKAEVIAELREEANYFEDAPASLVKQKLSPESEERQRRINEIAGGGLIEPVVIEPTKAAHYWALSREYEDILAAEDIVRANLRKAANVASSVIRERVREVHRELVRDLAAALEGLHQANKRYWALSDALNRDGVAWSALGPSFLRSMGHPSDPNSPIAQWFKEAARDGHIAAEEIPESLR